MLTWEFKRFGRTLLLVGYFLLFWSFFHGAGLKGFNEFGLLVLSLLFALLTIWALLLYLNPILLRLDDEGIYVRGKYFVPYEDIIAITTHDYFVTSHSAVVKKSQNISIGKFLVSGIFAVSPKGKKDVLEVHFPRHSTTNYKFEDVRKEIFTRHGKRTNNVLSYNYPIDES